MSIGQKYKAYPEYKDSGVEWLGDIPCHWICSALKRFCDVTDGSHHSPKIQSEGLPFISVTDVGINSIDFENSKKISELSFKKLILEGCKPKAGDVLLTKDGTIGRAALVKESYPEFVILSSLGLLAPYESVLNKYLYYYLISGINIDQMNSLIHGSALRRMTISKINELWMILPSIEEQLKITNFLDHETARIDTLIEEQQSLIKLLQEKRQAVISHAVTKGLNPDTPMKNSGVEWLGDVPEHWITVPLKLVVTTRKGIAFKSTDFRDAGVRVVKASDIKKKTIRKSNVFLPKSFLYDYPKALLKSGDIILSTVGSNPDVKNSAVGQIGMVPYELENTLLNQNTVIFDPDDKKILNEYLFYILQMEGYRDHLDLHAHGTANQSSLSIADMLNFNLSLPPIQEQREICNQLEEDKDKHLNLERNADYSDQLLKERRTALISAAVTGKIDVRDWQPPAQAAV